MLDVYAHTRLYVCVRIRLLGERGNPTFLRLLSVCSVFSLLGEIGKRGRGAPVILTSLPGTWGGTILPERHMCAELGGNGRHDPGRKRLGQEVQEGRGRSKEAGREPQATQRTRM